MVHTKPTPAIDLTTASPADLASTDFTNITKLVVSFPLSSFGSTNSLLDISGDLLEASGILEHLAKRAVRIATRLAED